MWLQAFILTQLVEIPLYSLALRDRTWRHRLLLAFGASALTHPLVWVVTGRLAPVLPFWSLMALVESFAVVAEAVYLSALGVRRPLTWAIVANAASFGIGLALEGYLFR